MADVFVSYARPDEGKRSGLPTRSERRDIASGATTSFRRIALIAKSSRNG